MPLFSTTLVGAGHTARWNQNGLGNCHHSAQMKCLVAQWARKSFQNLNGTQAGAPSAAWPRHDARLRRPKGAHVIIIALHCWATPASRKRTYVMMPDSTSDGGDLA